MIFDVGGVTSVTQLPAAGSPIAPGASNMTLTAMDAFGHSMNSAFTVNRVSSTNDTDGDGLDAASEVQMAALVFNWQVSQAALVNSCNSSANGAGCFTAAMNAGAQLLTRDAATGQFTLEPGLGKSSNLQTFTPFPFIAPQTSIQPNGKIRFQFTTPDNTAFLRLKALQAICAVGVTNANRTEAGVKRVWRGS